MVLLRRRRVRLRRWMDRLRRRMDRLRRRTVRLVEMDGPSRRHGSTCCGGGSTACIDGSYVYAGRPSVSTRRILRLRRRTYVLRRRIIHLDETVDGFGGMGGCFGPSWVHALELRASAMATPVRHNPVRHDPRGWRGVERLDALAAATVRQRARHYPRGRRRGGRGLRPFHGDAGEVRAAERELFGEGGARERGERGKETGKERARKRKE